MERMWRKVNHSFGGRSSKTTSGAQSADTTSSGGGFCDGNIVTIAVSGMTSAGGSSAANMPSSTATGRRLAASGQVPVPTTTSGSQQTATEEINVDSQYPKSLSQHVLLNSQASSDRRRRRRRKSRPRRSGVSCVGGGGGDNMSSSGGFYTIKESSDGTMGTHRHHRQPRLSSTRIMATSAPSGTVMMYPNINRAVDTLPPEIASTQTATAATAAATTTPDISLRQRAVAKLRMFNFHLNWDLHMTHCKPCGPRLGGGGSGNIIMRRLCRNRRHEDNELYRSNSFKFERFERKECIDDLTDTMKKQIAICDDYSLPVDFVKKRPSSFDPCLAEALPANPGNWAHFSPQAEFIALTETKDNQFQSQQIQSQDLGTPPPPPPPAPLSTLPTNKSILNIKPSIVAPNNTLPSHQLTHIDSQAYNTHSIQSKSHNLHNRSQLHFSLQSHPPLPTTIRNASIKLIEGYSDPKDSKRQKKLHHKRGKRRVNKNKRPHHQLSTPKDKENPKRSNCGSDSSGPKSSDYENNQSTKVPELNSPDSISDDLVHPLHSQLYRSPRKLAAVAPDTSKRNPSPYYYSDLLKSKDTEVPPEDKETKNKSRQSTISEPTQLTQPSINAGPYRKSTSLDVPENTEHDFDKIDSVQNTTLLPVSNETPKRYSFTEEGVHIIRCDSPTTSTSDESDCSECQKRRQWHARALALVRKTCNIQPISVSADSTICNHQTEDTRALPVAEDNSSMPPHKLFGPAICACVTPTIGDDIDEFFRPRSIFYVHPHGVHECSDCVPNVSNLNLPAAKVFDEQGPIQLNSITTVLDDDEMSGRTRKLYETAFDCKIAKSDDDLDEVDRITNHSVLFQTNSSSGAVARPEIRSTKSSHIKSRTDGKRLKNSRNHAIQEQNSNSGGNASGSGSPLSALPLEVDPKKDIDFQSNISRITTGLEKVLIRGQTIEQQTDAASTSTSQLPIRGYTPSPPSTAPLPMKFPGKHDRFLMNSIKSAPNLPSSNPAHPRLRDLRLPLQSSLRQQHQHALSICTSNENSLTDSAYVNPPSSTSRNILNIPHSNNSRVRDRPRSFVMESGRVLELRKSQVSHRHHVGNGGRRAHNYSSTESIATSSSGGSMESLRSSTSEGNRSTSSSESRNSTSLSSHSSESGSSSVALPLRAPIVVHSKLHILSPISDKSSQEPASELSEQNKTQHTSPEEITQVAQLTQAQQQISSNASTSKVESSRPLQPTQTDILKKKKPAPNKTLLHLADEIIGSDSGISLHSREDSKLSTGIQKFTLSKLNFPQSDKANESSISAAVTAANSTGVAQDLHDLPFDMPKLRRKKNLQQEACTSGSATSVDLGDLPFDMPKLRRRLRTNQIEIGILSHSTESSGLSQASSSHSMRDENKISMKLDAAIFRQNLTLNLNEPRQTSKFGSLDLRGLASNKELNLNIAQGYTSAVDLIDISIPLERQGWYHGAITRIEAEKTLRPLNEGSFLVRNCESTKQDYSLSLKGAKGFMHMRIQRNEAGQYILGQFSRPFEAVPDMIRHFCLNRLPVRGAEHMCLIEPVIVQLL